MRPPRPTGSTGGSLSRNGKTIASLNAGIDGVTVVGGVAGDTFDVEHRPRSRWPLAGGTGDDHFRLSPIARNLSNIDGFVTVFGDGGADRLTANDANNAVAPRRTRSPTRT